MWSGVPTVRVGTRNSLAPDSTVFLNRVGVSISRNPGKKLGTEKKSFQGGGKIGEFVEGRKNIPRVGKIFNENLFIGNKFYVLGDKIKGNALP
jgi:hypothetical protein